MIFLKVSYNSSGARLNGWFSLLDDTLARLERTAERSTRSPFKLWLVEMRCLATRRETHIINQHCCHDNQLYTHQQLVQFFSSHRRRLATAMTVKHRYIVLQHHTHMSTTHRVYRRSTHLFRNVAKRAVHHHFVFHRRANAFRVGKSNVVA